MDKTREDFGLTLKDCHNYLFPYRVIYYCAGHWYGKTDMDSLCLTENRIARGEWPNELYS